MTAPWHYDDGVIRVRKLCVGPLENNVYVVACASTGKAVIVDAAAEPDRIVAACDGVEPVAVLTTHGHHDHIGAATAVAAHFDIPVRIHPEDATWAGLPDTTPMRDDERIDFGRASVVTMHLPGHTAGSVCLVTDGVVFTGDTLFPGGPGATGGDPERFTRIMEGLRTKLFTLPDPTLVFPGHGLDTTIGDERPHLDEWQRRGW